jgi:uncharacterized protein (DUF1810 family)
MWFVFPQIAGLGDSAISRRYALPTRTGGGLSRAPVLGTRLVACCETAVSVEGRSAHEIFGSR